MAGYRPIHITGNKTGLVQDREEMILPDDAYPVLNNAFVFREGLRRKEGFELLGRLKRNFEDVNFFVSGTTPYTQNILNVSGYVETADNASPGQITTTYAHGLTTGDKIIITGIVGATGYNNTEFTITVVDDLNFTVGVNAAGFGLYVSGGFWLSDRSLLGAEPLASIVLGSVIYTIQDGPDIVFTDNGDGTLSSVTAGNSGTIDYFTGDMTITTTAGSSVTTTLTYSYFPLLPVMGVCKQELSDSTNWQTIFFDQKYAYVFDGADFSEYLPGTTWNKAGLGITNSHFFWETNYWISTDPPFTTTDRKVMWVTNGSGIEGVNADPPYLTNGVEWEPFYDDASPVANSPWAQIGVDSVATPVFLTNWLCNLPFRGRMVTANTWEGTSASTSLNYPNRIRWATIGNPFIAFTAGPPARGSWRDDIRGQGGFLDIPTSENIVSMGFVRDNLVIYCERSTWQLRYTGTSIAPFQIEKVNSELGTQSTFSSVQFDTSLMGIGDKGIVECDSYKSERIDIKIVDFVYNINNRNNGSNRIQGARDFINRIAYWTIPYIPFYDPNIDVSNWVFPNIRLIFNYENDSWAIFNDSLTALGLYQLKTTRNWLNTNIPWIDCHFPWINIAEGDPIIVGGNQQGFILKLDQLTNNDYSLSVSGITGNDTLPTVVTCPNHNMQSGFIIEFADIEGTFDVLNDQIFMIETVSGSPDDFTLFTYNENTKEFSDEVYNSSALTYIGGGLIKIRENFHIQSKKFNFLDQGKSIQFGYLDILTQTTAEPNQGEFALNVYIDYDDNNATNVFPLNVNDDSFFNVTIPTYPTELSSAPQGSKLWQRVYCPTRANFLTFEYTLSNEQMNGVAQELPIRIDAQVLWVRPSGDMTNT